MLVDLQLVLIGLNNLFAPRLGELVVLSLQHSDSLFHFKLHLSVVAAELVVHAVHHCHGHRLQLLLHHVAFLE